MHGWLNLPQSDDKRGLVRLRSEHDLRQQVDIDRWDDYDDKRWHLHQWLIDELSVDIVEELRGASFQPATVAKYDNDFDDFVHLMGELHPDMAKPPVCSEAIATYIAKLGPAIACRFCAGSSGQSPISTRRVVCPT